MLTLSKLQGWLLLLLLLLLLQLRLALARSEEATTLLLRLSLSASKCTTTEEPAPLLGCLTRFATTKSGFHRRQTPL